MQHGEREREMMIEVARLQGELRAAQSAVVREKDRAELAEAELARHEGCVADNAKAFDVSLGQCLDRAEKAEKALAAARRECDMLRAGLVEVRDNHVATGMDVRCYRCAVKMPCPTRRIADEALAAPAAAAGEEGK